MKLLQSVSHPNIIRLEEVIESPDCLVLILELAEGGDLYDQIIKESVLEESLARTYFQQITEAIHYLHSKQICHRDLKPENVMVCSSSSLNGNPVLKLTDLGLSKLVDQTILKTFCGTKIYMAPEMWKKAGKGRVEVYSLKVDCWALVRYRRTALQRSENRIFPYFNISKFSRIFSVSNHGCS